MNADEQPRVAVPVTRAVLDLLRERHIYQVRTGEGRGTYDPEYRERWREGDVLTLRRDCVVEPFSTIGHGFNLFSLGSFSSVMSSLPTSARVGRYASIGPNVRALGFRHPMEAISTSSAVFNPEREFVAGYLRDWERRTGQSVHFNAVPVPQPQFAPLIVGNDVWIGSDVVVRGGISIGDGAVIGARTVLTRDVPAYAVVGGNPVRFIRWRFDEELRLRLAASRWWEYELADLHRLPLGEPARFCDLFEREQRNLRPYRPDGTALWTLLQRLG